MSQTQDLGKIILVNFITTQDFLTDLSSSGYITGGKHWGHKNPQTGAPELLLRRILQIEANDAQVRIFTEDVEYTVISFHLTFLIEQRTFLETLTSNFLQITFCRFRK